MRLWFKRKPLLYITLYIVVMGAVASLLYSRYEIVTNAYMQSKVQEFDKRIESYQSMQQRMMDNYYGLFLASPRVSEIMNQAMRSDATGQMMLRRELYNRTKAEFGSLQKLDTRVLFFHLPKQVAFLRVHEPEKFGDDLSVARPSIVYAQDNKKKVVVFETGKYVSNFRSIYPLFYKGYFAGTVEMSYSFMALKRQAILQDRGAYTFLVKRSIVTKKSKKSVIDKNFQNSLFGFQYIEDQESALLKDVEGFEKGELEALLTEHKAKVQKALKEEKLQGIRLTHRGKDSLLILKPICQIGGEQAAYMIEITPNHTLYTTQLNQFFILLSLIGLLLALLMVYIYRYNRSILLSEQYRKAVEGSMIVSRTNPSGIITYANGLFVEMSGYSEEELLGHSHSVIRHPNTPKMVFEEMWNTLEQGRVWHGMLENRAKNGESYFVKSLICPIMDESGNLLEYLALREDVTEIQIGRLGAQEAQRIKAAFVANMSHEIRTPINAILGYIHLLSKTSLDTVQRRYITIVESSLETLLSIANDVLDYSKMEEGKIEIELASSNPKVQFPAVFELFIPQADLKQIEYKLTLDETIANCLLLDTLRIKQVLSNLIGNALKFTEQKGSVHVKIEVVSESQTNQVLKFSVIDTGIGVPKDKQSKIFEKFTQADISTTRQFGGTGLGLSIAYAMVGLMGGEIALESDEGKGSTFSFVIRGEKCNEAQDDGHNIEDVSQKPLDLRVLVVDDYELNRMIMGELLDYHYGIKPDFAANGEEGIAMVENNSYDLVFMDINMPVMDGMSAVSIIRKTNLDLPIVALTANVMRGDIEKFVAAGMNDFLGKPLALDELHRVIMHYSTLKELR